MLYAWPFNLLIHSPLNKRPMPYDAMVSFKNLCIQQNDKSIRMKTTNIYNGWVRNLIGVFPLSSVIN